MCKRTGWIEVLGCGMVHPAVFEAVGYDPERYTGFAFGIGIERIAILKHAVDDIRLFYDNDLALPGAVSRLRLLVSWLRDFVDVPVPPDELAAHAVDARLRGGRDRARVRRPDSARPGGAGGPGLAAGDRPTRSSTSRSRRTVRTASACTALAREVATAYGLPLRPLEWRLSRGPGVRPMGPPRRSRAPTPSCPGCA